MVADLVAQFARSRLGLLGALIASGRAAASSSRRASAARGPSPNPRHDWPRTRSRAPAPARRREGGHGVLSSCRRLRSRRAEAHGVAPPRQGRRRSTVRRGRPARRRSRACRPIGSAGPRRVSIASSCNARVPAHEPGGPAHGTRYEPPRSGRSMIARRRSAQATAALRARPPGCYRSRARRKSGRDARPRDRRALEDVPGRFVAMSAYCAARRARLVERPVLRASRTISSRDTPPESRGPRGRPRPFRFAGRPAALTRKIVGSVSLPSRRSLATGLPSTSSLAVKSRRSSTIWKQMPRFSPNRARACSRSSPTSPSIAPMRVHAENRSAVLRRMMSMWSLRWTRRGRGRARSPVAALRSCAA